MARIHAYLEHPDATERVKGCKFVRGAVKTHGVKALSDAVMPLLVARLPDADAQVRVWAAVAIRSLDDRALPELKRALETEQDVRARNTLASTIRFFEQARADQAARQAHPCSNVTPAKAMTWPVEDLCDPLGHYPPVLFELADGTAVYMRGKACFRGRTSRCRNKCLPAATLISTPGGPERVDALRPGAVVWTVDAAGRRVAAALVRVSAIDVGSHHQLVRLTLADGRAVQASSFHPTATGRLFGELVPGEVVDGSAVIDLRRVPNGGDRTFDILPAGETGTYFAEGVLLGSTLRASE